MLLEEIRSIDFLELWSKMHPASKQMTPKTGVPHHVSIREMVERVDLQPTPMFRVVFMGSMEEIPYTNRVIFSKLARHARDNEIALELAQKPTTVTHLLTLFEAQLSQKLSCLVVDRANLVVVNKLCFDEFREIWIEGLWFVWVCWQPALAEWSIGCKKANSDHFVCEGCRFIYPE